MLCWLDSLRSKLLVQNWTSNSQIEAQAFLSSLTTWVQIICHQRFVVKRRAFGLCCVDERRRKIWLHRLASSIVSEYFALSAKSAPIFVGGHKHGFWDAIYRFGSAVFIIDFERETILEKAIWHRCQRKASDVIRLRGGRLTMIKRW